MRLDLSSISESFLLRPLAVLKQTVRSLRVSYRIAALFIHSCYGDPPVNEIQQPAESPI